MIKIIWLLMITAALPLAACSGSAEPTNAPPSVAEESLHVHFLDVGQGDATLLQAAGCTLLIDAGRHDRNDVVEHLHNAEVETLQILIGTHPHADHTGQFPQVLEEFSVDEVWLSGWEHTTLTFERALDAILSSPAGYHEPRAGETVNCGPLRIEVLNPVDPLQNIHDNIAVRVTHGEVSFMFTGDAEAEHEAEMVARSHDLRAEVLQLGHHGSRTSTTQLFLDAVQPDVGIYSAPLDSQYRHPHDEVIERLSAIGIEIYGTAQDGTVTVVSDGQTYHIRTTNDPGPAVSSTSCVDLNTASRDQLREIIHVDEVRADKIIELRDQRPFDSVEETTRVHGIGDARREDIVEQGIACVR